MNSESNMRRSVTRRLTRPSEQSYQSQISGVLDPDSNVGSDENEGPPLWFKDLENNSTSARPSGRFSSARNDTPLLDSNSEPEGSPLRKSWWKELDHSPAVRDVGSDSFHEKEKSLASVEMSDASSEDVGIAKQKSALRREKRRIVSGAMFSLMSESSGDSSVGCEKVDSDTKGRDERASVGSPSFSGDDKSVEKVRKLPFRRKNAPATDKSAISERRSDASQPDIFQTALDASRWADDDRGGAGEPNSPRNSLGVEGDSRDGSINSMETIRLDAEGSSSKSRAGSPDESEGAMPMEDTDDDTESPKLEAKPRSEKRTILARTNKRKSPNFENLLNNESEDGSGSRHRINDEKSMQSTAEEDEPGAAGGVKKQRVRFLREKLKIMSRRTDGRVSESRNASDHAGQIDVRNGTEKPSRSGQENVSSDVERQSSHANTDRATKSRPSKADLEAEVGRSKSRTTPVRGVEVVSQSDIARLSTLEKSYPANGSGSSSAELGEHRTPRLKIRRSVVIVKRTSGSFGKHNRSSRLGSSDRAKHATPEKSARSMREESPAERVEGETAVGEDPAGTPGFIDRESPTFSESRFQSGSDADRPNAKVSSGSVERDIDGEGAGSCAKSTSIASQRPEKTFEAAQATDRDSQNKENRSHSAEDRTDREIVDPRFTSGCRDGNSSVRRVDSSSQVGAVVGASSNTEKVSRIRAALEEVKRKEYSLMKSGKIDSYFKIISKAKTDVPVQPSKKLQSKAGAVGKNNGQKGSVRCDKAYLVNGTVYKKPKLPRPKAWATDRLYSFLWKKMEPKYKLKTRIRSERFVVNLGTVVSLVTRRKKYENYKDELGDLIREMARLEIIKTRNDFNIFCQEFLPYDFRIKVVPMILPGSVRNIPFDPDELHRPILEP